MKRQRPINLDLATLKFPPMAITSILHRISGLIIFILLPFMLYCLYLSLRSAESFAQLQLMLQSPYYKVLIWGFSSAFAYHLIAGIRHLIMDAGFGEDLCAGRRSAIAVIVLAVISTFLLGSWIW